MTVVIPKFQDFFGEFGGELPLLTIVVIRTAGFLREPHRLDPGRRSAALFFFGSRWLRTSRGAPSGATRCS